MRIQGFGSSGGGVCVWEWGGGGGGGRGPGKCQVLTLRTLFTLLMKFWGEWGGGGGTSGLPPY